jgi:hypothetical protein
VFDTSLSILIWIFSLPDDFSFTWSKIFAPVWQLPVGEAGQPITSVVLVVDEVLLDVELLLELLEDDDVVVDELVVLVVVGSDVDVEVDELVVLDVLVVVGRDVDVEVDELVVLDVLVVVGRDVEVDVVDVVPATVLVVVGREVEVDVVDVDVLVVVGRDVEVDVVVDVVVVVVGHETPQQGRPLFWTMTGAGLTVAVITGGLVRHSKRFSAVAVIGPAIVMPVLARKVIEPDGVPPWPLEMTCPPCAISI